MLNTLTFRAADVATTMNVGGPDDGLLVMLPGGVQTRHR